MTWDGLPSKVLLLKNGIKNMHSSWLEPIDKGRPGLVICDSNGDAFCAIAIYEDYTLGVYDVSDVNAW